jgi:hypothetical protein
MYNRRRLCGTQATYDVHIHDRGYLRKTMAGLREPDPQCTANSFTLYS